MRCLLGKNCSNGMFSPVRGLKIDSKDRGIRSNEREG